MKLIILLLISILPISIYSQQDSTTIYFKSIADKDIRNICALSKIQIEKIFCKDTSLKGKVFNFIIKEFKKGKIKSTYDLEITSEPKKIPFVVNGDSAIYIIDYRDKAGFGKKTDSLTISFAGILKKKNFEIKIDFPGISISPVLKGNETYSLRQANRCSSNQLRVPIGIEYPVLVYTPPFDTDSAIQSYCMLTEENVLEWYEKFKIKHYYVIYLIIK